MELDQVEVGQRVRVNFPHAGDHGQAGTIMKVRGGKCYIHLDWDERLQRVVMFLPQDLELLDEEPVVHQTRA